MLSQFSLGVFFSNLLNDFVFFLFFNIYTSYLFFFYCISFEHSLNVK